MSYLIGKISILPVFTSFSSDGYFFKDVKYPIEIILLLAILTLVSQKRSNINSGFVLHCYMRIPPLTE